MDLDAVDFIIDPAADIDEREDVMRCLRTLLSTPAGTAPLSRDFGIDNSLVDGPMNVAQNILAVEIMEKVIRYEPRVRVKEVEFIPSTDGRISAKVVIVNA